MSKRVCVFVDGENFRHAIINLFGQFDPNDYLPKKANWDGLFDAIVSKVEPEGERIRTYWYVIELLDFFPYKFPSPESHPDTLRRLLNRDRWCQNRLKGLRNVDLCREMQAIVAELRQRQLAMRHRFEGWRRLQDGISVRSSRLEFRRAGAITYNLFDKSLGTEKAVDVKLAADLIVLRDIYDVAVIVSGDQDYVPAVQILKDSGKIVVNAVFRARSGRLLPGGARRLNERTDACLDITYDELLGYLNLADDAS
jgi:uncharacterized LabA/DUF88 family protein